MDKNRTRESYLRFLRNYPDQALTYYRKKYTQEDLIDWVKSQPTSALKKAHKILDPELLSIAAALDPVEALQHAFKELEDTQILEFIEKYPHVVLKMLEEKKIIIGKIYREPNRTAFAKRLISIKRAKYSQEIREAISKTLVENI